MQTINDTPKNKDSLFQTGLISSDMYNSFAETSYEKVKKAQTKEVYTEIKRVGLEDVKI